MWAKDFPQPEDRKLRYSLNQYVDVLETALGSLLFYIEFFQEPFLLILQRQDFSCKGK